LVADLNVWVGFGLLRAEKTWDIRTFCTWHIPFVTLASVSMSFASCYGFWSLALGVGTYLELGQLGVLWDGMLLRYRTACKAAAIMYVRKIGKIPS